MNSSCQLISQLSILEFTRVYSSLVFHSFQGVSCSTKLTLCVLALVQDSKRNPFESSACAMKSTLLSFLWCLDETYFLALSSLAAPAPQPISHCPKLQCSIVLRRSGSDFVLCTVVTVVTVYTSTCDSFDSCPLALCVKVVLAATRSSSASSLFCGPP